MPTSPNGARLSRWRPAVWLAVASLLWLLACGPGGGPQRQLAAPSGLTAHPGYPGDALLSWTPSVSAGVTHQQVLAGRSAATLAPMGAALGPEATSVTLTELAPGSWTFAIRADGADGRSSPPSEVATVVVADIPEGERLIEVDASLGADAVVVSLFLRVDGVVAGRVRDAEVSVNGIEGTFLPELDTYQVALGAWPAGGALLSLIVQVEGMAPIQADLTVPHSPLLTAPVSGTLLPVGAGLTAVWDYPGAGDPSHFEVWLYCIPAEDCDPSSGVEVAGDQRQLVIEAEAIPEGASELGLAVVARNQVGFSGPAWPSSTMEAGAQSTPAQLGFDQPETLSPPTGLVAHPGRNGEVYLWWTPSTDADATGQAIYYGTDPTAMLRLPDLSLAADAADHVLSGLPLGRTVHFAVRAEGGSAVSPRSAPAQATVNGVETEPFGPLSGVAFAVHGDVSSVYQTIIVYRYQDGGFSSAVEDATVTVNSVVAPSVGSGQYRVGDGLLTPSLGAAMTFGIQVPGQDAISGEGLMPAAAPAFTVPAEGADFGRGDLIEVAWDYSGVDPDRFQVVVQYQLPAGGSGFTLDAPGSARSLSFSAATLPSDSSVHGLWISARNDGAFTGPVTTNAVMGLTSPAGIVGFDVVGP